MFNCYAVQREIQGGKHCENESLFVDTDGHVSVLFFCNGAGKNVGSPMF